MKLTDEKIKEVAIAGGIYDCICDPYDKDGDGDQHSSVLYDLVRFARAILKEAWVEELERDAERFEPCAWMSISEKRFFDNGASAFVSPSSSFTRSDGIVLYKKAK